MNTCWKYDFYLCDLVYECELCKLKNCMADYIDSLKLNKKYREDIKLLEEDANKKGYVIKDIESHVKTLNENKNLEVMKSDLSVSLLGKVIKSEIKPLIIEERKTENYNLRASSIGKRCEIEKLISKASKEFLEKFEETEDQRIGNIIHTICLKQEDMLINNIKDHNRLIRRDEYCEREVNYYYDDLIVKGHADALLYADNVLIIFDLKKAMKTPYEKRYYKFQLLAYALAVNQQQEFSRFLLITANSPFPKEVKGVKRLQQYQITLIDKDDEIIKELNSMIVKSYEMQKRIVNDENFLKEYKKKVEKHCSKCLSKDICQYIISNNISFREILDKNLII